MLVLNHEDQEELDKLKHFFVQYGNYILSLTVLIIAIAAGYQWWQHEKLRKASDAEAIYTTLQNMQLAGQSAIVSSLASALASRYPDSPYAVRAELIAATSDIASHQEKAAIAALQWTVSHPNDAGLQDIVNLRLAGLLYDQHQTSAALSLLNAPHDEQYANLFNLLKGDILVQLKEMKPAQTAYQIALDKTPTDSPIYPIIQIKLNAISGVTKQ